MEPTPGRIVLLKLSAQQAQEINRRRTTGAKIKLRMDSGTWPRGAQAHIGNEAKEGDVVPMMIVRVWSPEMVNGQVFLDGNDTLWATSVHEGDQPGNYSWPVIQKPAQVGAVATDAQRQVPSAAADPGAQVAPAQEPPPPDAPKTE